MSNYERSHFTKKAEKVKILSIYEGIDFIDKMVPQMGDLYKGAIPKRGDCNKKLKKL